MKRLTALTATIFLLLALLTGCGGSSAAKDMAMPEMQEAPAAMAMSGNGTLTEASGGTASSLPENRKWIITVEMNAETEDLDAALAALEEKIAALEGYVEDQNIHNGSTYSSRRYRNANLTIRIPAEDVDAFSEEVAGLANVVSKNLSREDITLSYVATESKITALKTEETRLLELLAEAETMADLLEIEARLSDVRYELENYTSRLRLYDNQVDYATIHLFLEEVQKFTPVAEKTPWERIRDGFADSLDGLSDGIVDTVVWILASSPYLLVWGIILAAAFLLGRSIAKRRAVKKASKAKE